MKRMDSRNEWMVFVMVVMRMIEMDAETHLGVGRMVRGERGRQHILGRHLVQSVAHPRTQAAAVVEAAGGNNSMSKLRR